MLYLLWYSGNFTKGLLFTSNDRLLKKIEPINSLMEKAYAAQLFGNKKEWYDGRPNYR